MFRAALIAALLLSGCTMVQENTGACQKPPPLKQEERPKPPVAEYEQIWQPGYWDWDGRAYSWREGAWLKKTNQSGQWLEGYWDRPVLPGPCVWMPAHWQ